MAKFPRIDERSRRLDASATNTVSPDVAAQEASQVGQAIDKVNTLLGTAKAQEQNSNAIESQLYSRRLQRKLNEYYYDVENNPDKYDTHDKVAKGYNDTLKPFIEGANKLPGVKGTYFKSGVLGVVNKNQKNITGLLISTKQYNIERSNKELMIEYKKDLANNPSTPTLKEVLEDYADVLNKTNLSNKKRTELFEEKTHELAKWTYDQLYMTDPGTASNFVTNNAHLFNKDTDTNAMQADARKKYFVDLKDDLKQVDIQRKYKTQRQEITAENYSNAISKIIDFRRKNNESVSEKDRLEVRELLIAAAARDDITQAQFESLWNQLKNNRTFERNKEFEQAILDFYAGKLSKEDTERLLAEGKISAAQASNLETLRKRQLTLTGEEKRLYEEHISQTYLMLQIVTIDTDGVIQYTRKGAELIRSINDTHTAILKEAEGQFNSLSSHKEAFDRAVSRHVPQYNPFIKYGVSNSFLNERARLRTKIHAGKNLSETERARMFRWYTNLINKTTRMINTEEARLKSKTFPYGRPLTRDNVQDLKVQRTYLINEREDFASGKGR